MNEIDSTSIKRGQGLVSLLIGLFILGYLVSLFRGELNIISLFIGILLVFLLYEGYGWARVLFGILAALGVLWDGFVILSLLLRRAPVSSLILAVLLATMLFAMMSIALFSKSARAFLEFRSRQPKYLDDLNLEQRQPPPPHHQFSEKIRSHSKVTLPTYRIAAALPIEGSEDKIVLMSFEQHFPNVFRFHPDGTPAWQAQLPTDQEDVYTNLEWKGAHLAAFSRSCISVILDPETGRILSPQKAA